MVNKTIKQIIKDNPDKKVSIVDALGIWGELPKTEMNINCKPDAVQETSETIICYIG